MTDRDLFKQALKALEGVIYRIERDLEHDHEWAVVEREIASEAITALRERLEQPEQEPVGQLQEDAYGRGQVLWFNKPPDKTMLYTAPPKRSWVGLTDEEFKHFSFYAPWEIVQEVEAKLKEKNGG